MFNRVNFTDCQSTITIIAFILTFAAFLYFTWSGIRMKPAEREHMANLPLESDQESNQTHSKETL